MDHRKKIIQQMKSALLAIMGFIALAGCSGTRNIYFNVSQPSPVALPSNIKSIALIDRSIPQDKDKNKLEGIITGEGKKQDKLATQIVLDGLNSSLVNSGVYNVNRTDVKLRGSGAGVSFPAVLSWNEVEDLCETYKCDAIISLETYDSDFITRGASVGNKGLAVSAGGVAKVDCGFRLYDPQSKHLVDEFRFSHRENWHTGGNVLEAAVGAVMARNNAIQEASYQAGAAYAQRIIPSWYRAHREYYKKSKGNPYLEQGARMMETNDWDRAIEALKKAHESGKVKTKGRAAHNLAIVYEILGDLETAKKWASDAWGLYGEKRSRDYGYILTRRINEQARMN